jgi:hypothetical protein
MLRCDMPAQGCFRKVTRVAERQVTGPAAQTSFNVPSSKLLACGPEPNPSNAARQGVEAARSQRTQKRDQRIAIGFWHCPERFARRLRLAAMP